MRVATLDAEPGSQIEIRDVLLVADGESIMVGDPTVADAVVIADVVGHGRGKKVINFKFKAKTRYRRKRGHRQGFTTLAVKEVRIGAAPSAGAAAAPRRRARAATPAPEAAIEALATAVETPEAAAEAPAATPRRRRPAAEPKTEQE